MALENEKVDQNAMQLRICIYHQSHLSLFGNCWDPFEGSFSTFSHLRLYENSKEVLLVGDPFPYRDQQEGNLDGSAIGFSL